MAQYINKSALVAEIEKLIELAKFEAQQAQENNDYVSNVGWSEHFATCGDILKIINTLEVKEVDLEKEIDKWWWGRTWQTYGMMLNSYNIRDFAKRFFELGLKAQKGEII